MVRNAVLASIALLVVLVVVVRHYGLPGARAGGKGASERPALPALSALSASKPKAPHTLVAFVNGEPIELSEFEKQIAVERAAVFQSFNHDFGAADNDSFWKSRHNGVSAQDVVKKQALDALVRLKLQQIAMKEHGILKDTSYSAFVDRWKAENVRRAAAKRSGEPVYGPTQYSEDQYFRYEFNNSVRDLKVVLRQTTLAVPQTRLVSLYERLKGRMFRKSASSRVAILEFQRGPGDPGVSTTSARHAKQLLEQGTTIEQLVKALPRTKVRYDTYELTNPRLAIGNPVVAAAFGLEPHRVSEVISTGRVVAVVTCLSKDVVYVPFEEVKSVVENMSLDEAYAAYLEALAKTAHVDVKHESYAAAKVEG